MQQIAPCLTQAEIDRMWEKLSEGGEKGQCGWLKDRYGLSWQIVVPEWEAMLRDKDAARSERVMTAILTMTKPDLQGVQRAYAGRYSQQGEETQPWGRS